MLDNPPWRFCPCFEKYAIMWLRRYEIRNKQNAKYFGQNRERERVNATRRFFVFLTFPLKL
jgi:hypothetical protein